MSLAEGVRTEHKEGQNGWRRAWSTLMRIRNRGRAQKYETDQDMKWSPGSSVRIVLDYGTEARDILTLFPAWSRIISSPKCAERVWVPPSNLPFKSVTKGAFCKVKRPVCESDNSYKPSVEIRKMWSYISIAKVFLE